MSRESREYLGSFALTQSEDCFKLGRDSILLSRFATVKPGYQVCDLGCGIGSLLLLLSQRTPELTRWGVEIDPVAAALAERNLLDNSLTGDIILGDLREVKGLPTDAFHLVISNPPYFRQGTGLSGGRARMEEALTVTELCLCAARLLRTGGRFALVFRPERLSELFVALESVRIAPKRMQMLSYNRAKTPYAVLVEGVKEGGAGLEVLPVHYQEEE